MPAKKSIKGFSRYTTDGAGVFLRSIRIRPSGDVYRLIPDNGDGVNLAEIKVEEALSGNEDKCGGSVKATPKRLKEASKRDAISNTITNNQAFLINFLPI